MGLAIGLSLVVAVLAALVVDDFEVGVQLLVGRHALQEIAHLGAKECDLRLFEENINTS